MFPDRYSSAAVMSPDVNNNWIEGTGPTKSTYFLFGLTDKPAADLAPLARSWLHPPQLRIDSAGYAENGYRKSERAYFVVRQQQSGIPSALRMKLEGSTESPVVDPAIIIKDWGMKGAKVSVDGKGIQPGTDLGVGHINRLEGTDLVLWMRRVSTQAVTINVVPDAD
jgi:hypothetical protein